MLVMFVDMLIVVVGVGLLCLIIVIIFDEVVVVVVVGLGVDVLVDLIFEDDFDLLNIVIIVVECVVVEGVFNIVVL